MDQPGHFRFVLLALAMLCGCGEKPEFSVEVLIAPALADEVVVVDQAVTVAGVFEGVPIVYYGPPQL